VLGNETFEADYESEFFASFICAAFALLCLASCGALTFRIRWGKWLTIFLLSGVLLLFAVPSYDDSVLDYANEDTDEWLIVSSLMVLVIYAPCLLLTLTFLLDRKVKIFFSRCQLED
jgi:hypothetical protein